MRSAERGLTLLEVLGAVALLGILYTVLAGSAIEGLRSEGESRRRLRASLLADERMAEVELALQAGAAPPLGAASEELEGFTILTEVSAFQPPPPRADAGAPGGEPRSLAARRAEAERAQVEVPSLFAVTESPTTPPALRTIDVVVRWEEGSDEREIRRTTYALDPEAIDKVFSAVTQLRPGSGVEPEEGTDETLRRRGKPAKAPARDAEPPFPEAPEDAP